jgi:hypothetical protein
MKDDCLCAQLAHHAARLGRAFAIDVQTIVARPGVEVDTEDGKIR